ncbi:MAG: ABC transporter ATP-binding protein [Pleomorphochaeta sp.]|jgi:ABC-2 type transport system ATP-binding protein
METEKVLQINNLTKKYSTEFTAVDKLNLNLNKGEIFGLLGPNGSGKTTTLLMILGLIEPTEGEIEVLGLNPLTDPLKVKSRIGYLPDSVGFYEDLNAFENIEYTSKLLNIPKETRDKTIVETLEKMGLKERMYEKVSTYSHGMKQRLGLCEIIIKHPEIAILDEPTQGLDPKSIKDFLDIIKKLNEEEKMTILISSHQLNEVQYICDNVGLFSKGKLLAKGSVKNLSKQIYGEDYLIELDISSRKNISNLLKKNEDIKNFVVKDGIWHLSCTKDIRSDLVNTLVENNININKIATYEHSLDEVYNQYYKGGVDE